MAGAGVITQVRRDFAFTLQNEAIKGVVLYGSHVTGDHTPRSDIDVCIVAPGQDLYRCHKYIYEHLERNVSSYDIRFFEELPLSIQGTIIESGVVVLAPDEGSLSEYFYTFRKRWEHEKWRITHVA